MQHLQLRDGRPALYTVVTPTGTHKRLAVMLISTAGSSTGYSPLKIAASPSERERYFKCKW